jgi:hypothetical protein
LDARLFILRLLVVVLLVIITLLVVVLEAMLQGISAALPHRP